MTSKRLVLVLAILCMIFLCGCVDQHPQTTGETAVSSGAVSAAESPSQKAESENEAVTAAQAKVNALGRTPRVIATSPATVEICNKLDLELVGVSSSKVTKLPEKYANTETIGSAMSPDMEKISSLQPDWILSPASLQSDLQKKYETIGCDWAFVNLQSVQGMYRSIEELGTIFGRKEKAQKMVREFDGFHQKLEERIQGKTKPRVLILMGMPGSYVIATPRSYVGNLVELAGGKNVYEDSDKDFINVNTEDMKTKEPDIILRAAHAMPEDVVRMFDKEFKNSSIWKHFKAVEDGKVYDLPYDLFGMSASFQYPEAVEMLEKLFYEEKEKTGNE